ncbi:MAG: hypothetical protein VKO64_12750 [Candidatus Sericytochromatia bacterium]|nr:hypothetical protein [Candidatus Sericytochromatia bacterium]
MTPSERPLSGLARDEAFAAWAAGLVLPAPRPVSIDDAAGCVLAVPVAARLPVPSRDEAACMGLAARSEDLEDPPVRLLEAPRASRRLPRGHVCLVEQGDSLPDGADVVLPMDYVRPEGDAWMAQVVPSAGAFVRQAGEELAAGDPVLEAGASLTPERLAQLARAGWGNLLVLPVPRVATLLVTDRSVDPAACDPGGPPPEDRGPWLHAMLSAFGHQPLRLGWARPDAESLPDRVESAAELADLLLLPARRPEDVARRLLPTLGSGALVLDLPGEAGPAWVVRSGERRILVAPLDPWGLAAALHLLAMPMLRRLAGRDDGSRQALPADDEPLLPPGPWWPCRLEGDAWVPLELGEAPLADGWLHPDRRLICCCG